MWGAPVIEMIIGAPFMLGRDVRTALLPSHNHLAQELFSFHNANPRISTPPMNCRMVMLSPRISMETMTAANGSMELRIAVSCPGRSFRDEKYMQ